MRTLEVILVILGTLVPFFVSFGIYSERKKIVNGVLFLVLVVHLLLEGCRWQMVPGYMMTILAILMVFKEWKWSQKGFLSTVYILCFLIFLVLPGWLLPYVLPVFKLPTPTGQHAIGSKYFLIKSDDAEAITNPNSPNREFMIKVWYPADVKDEKKEAYLDRGNRLGFSTKYGLPEFTMKYLDYIKTHTYENPALEKGNYPVLIFSHGYHSMANGYYAILEEIVSHGYIILNINHTYESSGALFPNGDIKLYDEEWAKENNNEEMAEMAWNALQNYNNASSNEEQLAASEYLIKNYIAAEITERWTRDIEILLEKIEENNTFSFLNGHVDFSKIGVLGHSQGGAVAGQIMLGDNRILAGINIDGAQWGKMIDTSFQKPFMWISADWPEDHMDINKFSYRNLIDSLYQKKTIKNSGHSNFMDIPLMVNLSYLNESGTINPYDAYKEVTHTIIQFFDNNLNKNLDYIQ